MQNSIKTLQIQHLEKRHQLKKEIVIMRISEFFDKISTENHYRNRFYSLFIFTEGSYFMKIDDQDFEISADQAVFLNYNQVYNFYHTEIPEGFVIIFTKTFYNHVYTGNKLIKSDTALNNVIPKTKLNAEAKKEILKTLENIRKEYLKINLYSKEILCLQIKILMLQYIRITKNSKQPENHTDHKKEWVEKFSALVDQHYKNYKNTAPYAEILGITANYLNTLVKENLGMNAGKFIKNRVILEAERLLLHTSLSVAEISFELGFTDNSHFGKYFKSAHQLSPKIYRQQQFNDRFLKF